MKVTIEFLRPGKKTRVYHEDLLSVDEQRLRTSSLVRPQNIGPFSSLFQRSGLIAAGSEIRRVDKYHFFHLPFGIMRLFDVQDGLLGTYSDIATPLEHSQSGYRLVDLFLDLWIQPDGVIKVLDEDEFEEALTSGVLTRDQGDLAIRTLARLLSEARLGHFPADYIT